MPRRSQVALVTGATKGFGYHIGKELIRRVPSTVTYMSSRGDTGGMDAILGMELGGAARQRGKFITMDVTDPMSISAHRDAIVKRYGGLDILVNNAAIYEKPDMADFKAQSKRLLATNYWGTKNVYSAFYSDLKQDARIVNITSNLAHVKEENTSEVEELKRKTRDRFEAVSSLCELDGMVLKFQFDADTGRCKSEGWPECAYSVSKMAINTFTRLLQEEFDRRGRDDVMVNAAYPATKHSKIDQRGYDLMTDQQAAEFIFYLATSMPNYKGIYPRGEVIWENSMAVLKDRVRSYHSLN